MAREHVPARYDTRTNNSGEKDYDCYRSRSGRWAGERQHSDDPEVEFFARHNKYGKLDIEARSRLSKRVHAKGVCFDVIMGVCTLAGGKMPSAPYYLSIHDGNDQYQQSSSFSSSFIERRDIARKSSPLFAKLLKHFGLGEIIQMYEFCLQHVSEHDMFTLGMLGFEELRTKSA